MNRGTMILAYGLTIHHGKTITTSVEELCHHEYTSKDICIKEH